MDSCFSDNLRSIFRANGLESFLTPEKELQFARLTDELLRVNASLNLTAVTDPCEIILKHYADCASVASDPPKSATLTDIGAGAGFPTLPLAILRPDLRITAVDSTEKRMRYVAQTAQLLGLKNVTVRTARAEELGRDPAFREQSDFVTARAVARLNVLCEWCLPLVRIGGIFCAMKSVEGPEEEAEARHAITLLGGNVQETRQFSLQDPDGTLSRDALRRTLILIRKESETPEKYPRRNARIQSDPL